MGSDERKLREHLVGRKGALGRGERRKERGDVGGESRELGVRKLTGEAREA